MGAIHESLALAAVEAVPELAAEIPFERRLYLRVCVPRDRSLEFSSGLCLGLRLAAVLASEEAWLEPLATELQYLEGLAAEVYLSKKLLGSPEQAALEEE